MNSACASAHKSSAGQLEDDEVEDDEVEDDEVEDDEVEDDEISLTEPTHVTVCWRLSVTVMVYVQPIPRA
jgi:hypothetical protein